jgi:hypothetical protein
MLLRHAIESIAVLEAVKAIAYAVFAPDELTDLFNTLSS